MSPFERPSEREDIGLAPPSQSSEPKVIDITLRGLSDFHTVTEVERIVMERLPASVPKWLTTFQHAFEAKYGPTGAERLNDLRCSGLVVPVPDNSFLFDSASSALVLEFGGSGIRASITQNLGRIAPSFARASSEFAHLSERLEAVETLAVDVGGILHTDSWEGAATTLLRQSGKDDSEELGRFARSVFATQWREFRTRDGDPEELYAQYLKQCVEGLSARPEFENINTAVVSDAIDSSAKVNHAMVNLVVRAREIGKHVILCTDNTKFFLPAQLERLATYGLSLDPDDVISSADFGVSKKDGLFEHLAERCDPAKTLYLDDRAHNCAAATETGFLSQQLHQFTFDHDTSAQTRELECVLCDAWEGFGAPTLKHIHLFRLRSSEIPRGSDQTRPLESFVREQLGDLLKESLDEAGLKPSEIEKLAVVFSYQTVARAGTLSVPENPHQAFRKPAPWFPATLGDEQDWANVVDLVPGADVGQIVARALSDAGLPSINASDTIAVNDLPAGVAGYKRTVGHAIAATGANSGRVARVPFGDSSVQTLWVNETGGACDVGELIGRDQLHPIDGNGPKVTMSHLTAGGLRVQLDYFVRELAATFDSPEHSEQAPGLLIQARALFDRLEPAVADSLRGELFKALGGTDEPSLAELQSFLVEKGVSDRDSSLLSRDELDAVRAIVRTVATRGGTLLAEQFRPAILSWLRDAESATTPISIPLSLDSAIAEAVPVYRAAFLDGLRMLEREFSERFKRPVSLSVETAPSHELVPLASRGAGRLVHLGAAAFIER